VSHWDELRAAMREVLDLDAVVALLGWDEETYLPPEARADRGRQVALLEGLRHQLLLAPRFERLLDEAEAQQGIDGERAAIVRLLRRRRERASRLPEALVRALAEARSASLDGWERARAGRDFRLWAPSLARLIELTRERADAGVPLVGTGDRYDALLDEHEPAMTRARLEPVLFALRDGLAPMQRAIAELDEPAPAIEAAPLAPADEARLVRRVLVELGFDFARGRHDRSTHPFTLHCGAHDVRLTTRAAVEDPLRGLLTVAHEGGHALYDQGFDPRHAGTVLADAPSLGMHEGQARLWENHVARRPLFWERLLPALRELAPTAFARVSVEQAHRAVNAIAPGPVRVDADELSYDLHVLVRYRLEVALLAGDLAVADLPQAWREAMARDVGVTPHGDLDGCLQDVHWALGALGYFPSYTLGNLYAAQLYQAWQRQAGGEAALAAGDLSPLREWLRRHVWQPGRRHTAEEIVQAASGAPISAAPLLSYLEEKYG